MEPITNATFAGIERRRGIGRSAKQKAKRKSAFGGVLTNVVVATRGDRHRSQAGETGAACSGAGP